MSGNLLMYKAHARCHQLTKTETMNYENYDPCFPDQPVVDLYLPVWANQPSFCSKPAFIWVEDGSSNHSTLTYAQLNYSAHSIASHLLNVPLMKTKDTVLILCSPGLQLVSVLFGCQRAGLVSVPLSPPDPSSLTTSTSHDHHLIRVLLQTKPKAAIAQQNCITGLRHYISSSSSKNKQVHDLWQNLIWISVDDMEVADCYNTVPSKSCSSVSTYQGCKPDDVYLIQYTSGATGIPKPVLVTAGSAAHNVRTARKAYDLLPSSIIVSWLPQYHDCGLMFLLLTVVAGSTCVLTSPKAFVRRPGLWLELITKFKATCTPVPSFTLPLVIRRGGLDQGIKSINLWSLRNLIIINEPIYQAPVKEFIAQFTPFGLNPYCISPSYGLAENGTFVSTAWRPLLDHDSSFSDQFPSYKQLLPSARLASNTLGGQLDQEEEEDIDIVVVNEETHEPVDDGTEGEIWIASASNGSGYLGYPCLTHEVFHATLSGRVSKRFLRTGDRGVIIQEEARYLFVMGRCSDVIKLDDGRDMHPHYIETAAYNSCPELLRGGCLAAFQVSTTIVIMAEMQGCEADSGILRRVCEGIREEVWKKVKVEIGSVVLVKSGIVPKTTSGKVQRWAAKNKLIRGEMRILSEVNFATEPVRGQEGLRNHFSSSGTRLCLWSLL